MSAKGDSLHVLDEGAVLFDGSAQSLYQLNAASTLVWLLRAELGNDDAVCRRLCQHYSLSSAEVRSFVHEADQALAAAKQISATRVSGGASVHRSVNTTEARQVAETTWLDLDADLSAIAVRVSVVDSWEAVRVRAALGARSANDTGDVVRIRLLPASGARKRVVVGDQAVGPLWRRAHVATATRHACERALFLSERADSTLHAAAVARNDQVYVLTGDARSGKSTLACVLGYLGAEVLAEDVLPLTWRDKARLWPHTTAIGLKQGSWPVLARYGLEPAAHTQVTRPDGRRELYVPVKPIRRSFPVAGARFVHVSYDPAGRTELTPVSASAALAHLLARLYPRAPLRSDDVKVVVEMVRESRHYRLRFADVEQAAKALLAL